MPFAEGTSVSVMKTKVEIDTLLRKQGALRTGVAEEPGRAVVFFDLKDRRVQMSLRLPSTAEIVARSRRRLTSLQLAQRAEQEQRERWRALLLAIKAKFVAVESGVETFEEAFLAHVVMPGGRTLGQMALPQVAEAYKGGKVTERFLLGEGA